VSASPSGSVAARVIGVADASSAITSDWPLAIGAWLDGALTVIATDVAVVVAAALSVATAIST
jgi:hypothetical protein